MRLRRLCLFIFKRRFFFKLPISNFRECIVSLERFKCKKTRAFLSEDAGHKTGDDLLSHSSVAALPSAIKGLTSVFGMGTCVSPYL
jgi:hypothetical protein